jgi:hypothetical protein
MVSDLDDAKLGRLFASPDEPDGLTGKAIRNWITGEGTRDPEHVPAGRMQRLTETFCERMPQPHTLEEVRALLLSPSEQGLVLALLSGAPQVDWMTLVMGASRGTAQVLTAGRSTARVSVRRSELESLRGDAQVAVGQPFRLRLSLPRPGWLCVVQWGDSGWFGVELADRRVALQVDEGDCLLPPAPPYLTESEVGTRRYLFMLSQQPFPPDVVTTLLHSARATAPLHADALVRLAHVVAADAVDLTALDVEFTEPAQG